MDKLKITGPNKLKGDVSISASKNATLPILAATLLFPEEIEFTNLPGLSDINFFLQILESLGAKVTDAKNIDCETIDTTHADYDLVRKMRASILVLGPLLSRCGEAEVSLPGGCLERPDPQLDDILGNHFRPVCPVLPQRCVGDS